MKRNSILMLAITCAFGSQQAFAAQPTLEEKLEVMQQEIEALKAQSGKNSAAGHSANIGPGSTTVGGYGEAIYNNYKDGSEVDQADLRRFVLFFGHKFNNRLSFNSELEVEHAWIEGGKGGEVAMEQAYLELGLTDSMNARAGLMLVPMGILNETHEPPAFYGVERNQVESLIIPSTWRELGVALQGQAMPGLEYNFGISTSLDAGRFDSPEKGLRESRTAGGEAPANDLALFGALNYRAVPGLLLGASIFTGNTGQDGASNAALKGVDGKLMLWDMHTKYSVGGLELQALYASGTLDDAAAISAATGKTAPESLYGWYGQAAYRVWQQGDMDAAPFVRYERYNTQDSVGAGYTADPLNDETVTTVGVNFRLHPQVVVKADIQNFKKNNLKDRINLGVGYMF